MLQNYTKIGGAYFHRYPLQFIIFNHPVFFLKRTVYSVLNANLWNLTVTQLCNKFPILPVPRCIIRCTQGFVTTATSERPYTDSMF